MAGATPVFVTLRPPDYRLDVDALRAAVTPRTRLLLVNSPHNPTGTVLDRATSWRPSPPSPSSTTCSSSPTRCTST